MHKRVQVKAWPDALRVALRLDDREKVESVMGQCSQDTGPFSQQERQQLAYILASQAGPAACVCCWPSRRQCRSLVLELDRCW